VNVYEFHWYLNDLIDFFKNAQIAAFKIQFQRCLSPFLVPDNLKKIFYFILYCYIASITSLSLVY